MYNEKVDVFSFGAMIFKLLFGKDPFKGKDIQETYLNNEKVIYDFPETSYYDLKHGIKKFNRKKNYFAHALRIP